jgi:hypothetical protein
MWNRRPHPNILPLLGVSDEDFTMVSEWMEHGNIRQFVLTRPDVNRPSVVSRPTLQRFLLCLFPQLLGATDGLIYLHSHNLIHGDLKGVRGAHHSDILELRKPFSAGEYTHKERRDILLGRLWLVHHYVDRDIYLFISYCYGGNLSMDEPGAS